MHKKLVTLAVTLALTACATQTPAPTLRSSPAHHDSSPFAGLIDSGLLESRNGMRSESQLGRPRLCASSRKVTCRRPVRAINAALQLDDRDSWLHFLNGFVCHLQARQGDSQKNDLGDRGLSHGAATGSR